MNPLDRKSFDRTNGVMVGFDQPLVHCDSQVAERLLYSNGHMLDEERVFHEQLETRNKQTDMRRTTGIRTKYLNKGHKAGIQFARGSEFGGRKRWND